MKLNRLTLNELLKYGLSHYGSLPLAGYVDEDAYTFREYGSAVVALYGFLREKGIRRGDRIAILAENSPYWGICYLSVTTYGAVAVPLLTDFQSGEIGSILAHAEVKGICLSEKMEAKHSDALPGDVWRLQIDSLTEPGAAAAFRPTAASSVVPAKSAEIPDDVAEDDPAVIIYTSGTTGSPKGVSLTHKNIVHNVVSTSYIPVKLRPGDRLLSILPLAHTYECTIGFLTPILIGCSIHYLHSLPAPTVLMPALKSVRPHVMLSVPLLMEKLYRKMVLPRLEANAVLRFIRSLTFGRKLLHRLIGRKLKATFGGNLKYFIVGGAALSAEVEQFLNEAGFPLAKGYGLTETSPLVAGCTPAYDRIYTVGTPLEGVEVRIDSAEPHSQPGEILVKGPNVTSGYYREPERTAAAFTEDGWFRTGDLGVLDADGYLSIKGRLKNLILGPSGENIYPEEIEELLNRDELVSESLVVEEANRLIARVYVEYETIKEFGQHHIEQHFQFLRKTVNSQLAAFSRLAEIKLQKEPFKKTPTNKIKRYLYSGGDR
ncbi:MAG: AMP-binding protein [Spirochaetota bacterium]